MNVRITLINGGTIDFPVPEDFNFVHWVTSVRESGRFLVDNCYVPHESILWVAKIDETGKPDIKGLQ